MLDYKSATELMLSTAGKLPAGHVELYQALHRVLAEDVFCDTDLPPFDKSAMDGYACRKVDMHNELEVVETVHAGKLPEKTISKNQCSKIMTGAMIPAGADLVFKKEDAQITGSGLVRCLNTSSLNHICYKGEDVKKGDKVLDKSTLITARHLPLLAGAGVTRPKVYDRPEIAIFATGTELVEPHENPLSFQIRNTNTSQLTGKLAELQIPAFYGGILPDNQKILAEELVNTFRKSNVVILTGGVSVGDFDLIPDVLTHLGFKILVRSTAIKPGKPMVFAHNGNNYCFGLSGNPVSSYVQFELFVKPFLYALMGHEYQPVILKLPLAKELNREISDRVNFLPANISADMEVVPVEFHGSAHIHALAGASYLFEVEKGSDNLKKGTLVNVRQL